MYTIEKNMPMPKSAGRSLAAQTLSRMEIGDSIHVNTKHERESFRNAARRLKIKINSVSEKNTNHEGTGFRIWRMT